MSWRQRCRQRLHIRCTARPSYIAGATPRSLFNTMVSMGVYATICRYRGLPLRYPGSRYTWEHFCDMSDSRLLAEQQIWAATTESAKNQAFNCTNGDFFTWKKFWKAFCQVFDVEFDEEEECGFDVVGMMAGMGHVWDEIVEKHGLVRTKMADITCFDAVTVVTNFKFQHVCSMNKSRKFGFLGYCNTLGFWVTATR
ncbi:unnamed protein product [Linum tenue]|uniref:Uncharacterized protein n=1 Tax=Linum tenue TaxID=586396 RepID=A0AAV0QZ75_9ROSI|nr:unnamed protein product [Linum tenue]